MSPDMGTCVAAVSTLSVSLPHVGSTALQRGSQLSLVRTCWTADADQQGRRAHSRCGPM